MNRNYKVVWNRSLGCFMAVAEYAKSRGKSSNGTVSSSSAASSAVSSSAKVLRLTAICAGLAASGFSMQVMAGYEAGGGSTFGNCTTGSIGNGTESTGIAIAANQAGSIACAPTRDSIAIGSGASTKPTGAVSTNNQSIAIGYDSLASGDQAIGLGGNTRASGSSSIAIGGDDLDTASRTNTNGTVLSGGSSTDNLNLGSVNTKFFDISGRNLVNIANRYPSTTSSGVASVAVGVQARSTGALSTAFGTQTQSEGIASAAFGVSASASKDGSVALGAGSSTLTDANSVTEATVNGFTYGGFAGSTGIVAGDQVSVGSNGRERQIKSVAAGNVTESSTDAINGSQLFSVANKLSNTPLTFAGDTGASVDRKLGQTLNVKGGATTPANLTDGNIGVVANNTTNTLTIKLNKDVDLGSTGSVKTGATTVNNTGLTLGAGNPSITTSGIDAGNKVVTGVANGSTAENSKEAVNGGQLKTTNDNVTANQIRSQGNTTALGGTYVAGVNGAAGTYTPPTYNVVTNPSNATTTPFTTVKGAVEQLSSAVQTPLTFTGNTGTTNRKLGETLAITGSGNLSTVSSANGVAISLSDTPTFSRVTVTGAPIAATDVTNKGYVDGTRTQVTSSNGTVGITSTTNATTNATTFNLAVNSQAVANNAQLPVVYTKADGTQVYKVGTQFFDNAAGTGTAVAPADIITSIRSASGSTTAPTKLTNVAAGDISASSKDAINGSQLKTTNDNVTANQIRSQGNTTALGGTYTPGVNGAAGTYTPPTYNVVTNPSNATTTPFTTVKGAVEQLSGAVQTPLTFTGNVLNDTGGNGSQQKLGSTLNIAGGAATTAASSNANVKTVITDGKVDIQIVDAPTFAGQVKANGFDASGQKIVNVAAGSALTDAANIGQLQNATNSATNSAPVVYTKADGTQVYKVGTQFFENAAGTGTAVAPADIITSIRSASGSTTAPTRLTNVAAGIIGAASTDAINGSQLANTNQNVAGNTTALGGTYVAGVNGAAGTYTPPTYNVVTNPSSATTTPFTTVKGAVEQLSSAVQTPLTFTGNTGTTNRKLGETLAITGSGNLSTVSSANGVAISLSDTPTFSRVTVTGAPIAATDVTNKGYVDGTRTQVTSSNGTVGITSTTNATTNATTFNLAVNSQAVANSAQLPVVYTNATGARVYKQANGDFTTNLDGTGTVVLPANIITSVQSAGGSTTAPTRLTNVAAGAINATSTDAINGSQLANTNQNVAGNTTALGGTYVAGVNGAAGTYTAPTYNVVTNPSSATTTPFTTVKGAVEQLSSAVQTPLTFTGNQGVGITKKLGETLNIEGALANAADASGANLRVDSVNGKLNLVLAKNLTDIDSLKIGSGANITTLTSTVNGLDVGNRKITNVANGTIGSNSKDAINGGQINTLVIAANTKINNVGTSTAKNLGGGSTYDAATGNISAPTFNVRNSANTKQTTVAAAIDALNQGFKLQSDGANTTSIQPSEIVDIGTADNETNIKVAKTGNVIDFSLNKNLDLSATGSMQIGDSLLNNNGLTITNGPRFTTTGIDAGNQQITGVLSGGNTATNAANIGDVQSAVTGVTNAGLKFKGDNGSTITRKLGQRLDITGGATGTLTTNNIGVSNDGSNGLLVQLAKDIDLGTNGSVKTGNTVVNDDGISIVGGTQGNGNDVRLTKDGLFNGGNTIKGVGDGRVDATSNQAINGSQLFGTATSIKNAIGGETVVNTDGTITTTNIGGTGLDNIDDAIGAVNTAATKAKTTVTGVGNVVVNKTNADDGPDNYEVKIKDDLTLTSVTTGNTTLNNAGISILGGTQGNGNDVRLTKDGLFNGGNTIKGVGNGRVDSTSNQAINGSQLFGTAQSIAKNLGGNSTVNADGTISAPNYVLDNGNGGTASFDNVGDALGGLDNRVTDNATDIKNITNGTTGIVRQDPTNGSISIGNQTGGTTVDFSGTQGNRVLTGVANGLVTKDSNDAINGSQLFDQGTGIASIIGGDTAYDAITGKFTNANIGGTGKGTLDEAIKAVDARAGAKTKVTAGSNVNVETIDNGDGSNSYKVSTQRDLDLDSASFGEVKISADGLNNGGKKVTNVGNGTVGAGSKDAITGDQLFTTSNSIKDAIGGSTVVNPDGTITTSNVGGTGSTTIDGAISAVNTAAIQAKSTVTAGKNIVVSSGTNANGSTNYQVTTADDLDVVSIKAGNTTVNNDGVTIKDGPSLTAGGINAGGKVVTGVADGIQVNDAVNVGQFNNFGNQVNSAINDLGYRIDDVADDANAGISAAMAMSSIPQSFIPGKSMVGGGISSYNGEGAVAVGLSRVSDNGRWVMKVNGTADTKGNAGGAVGAGFHF